MHIAIIGAGLAGLACATRLAAAGHGVQLFDKGRGPGGRMATRRMPTPLGEAGFDHGAQYFTARDPGFIAEVARWQAEGLAAPWPAAGPDAWVGTPAMNAPVKALARPLPVQWGAMVTALARDGAEWRVQVDGAEHGPFDAAVVTVPAEQAAPLLAPWDPAAATLAAATRAEPCWTVMAAFAARLDVGPDILREAVPGAAEPIGWAARNSAKPGRTGPESWVIQAGPAWSRDHLELSPEAVLPLILTAFATRIGPAPLPAPLVAAAHRWRFAKSGRGGVEALWNPPLRLGVCGDWLLGPRVECAWASGDQLAGSIGGAAQPALKPVATT